MKYQRFIQISLLLIAAAGTPGVAQAASKSAFDFGINYYGTDSGKSLTGATGYYAHFQVKSGKKWLYPTFGATLEYASDNASLPSGTTPVTLMAGQIEGGLEILPRTEYLKPFIGVQALLGWASLSDTGAQTSSLAITYGFSLSGGTEFRFSSKDDASGLRLRTGYRFMLGSLGGVSGFQLNALQIGIGMVF